MRYFFKFAFCIVGLAVFLPACKKNPIDVLKYHNNSELEKQQIPLREIEADQEAEKAENIYIDERSGDPIFSTPTPSPTQVELIEPVKVSVPSEKVVTAFLNKNCSQCHGFDENGKPRDFYQAWPMPSNFPNKEALEVSVFTSIVYQSLLHKLMENPPDSPSAMPKTALSEELRSEIKGVLAWFQSNLPFVVAEAEAVYGGDTSEALSTIQFSYSCEDYLDEEAFAARFFLALFERQPNQEEKTSLALKPGEISLETKAKLIELLDKTAYKDEFKQTGLKKLAETISGSGSIEVGGSFPEEVTNDFRQELYQMMDSKLDTWSYLDYYFRPFVRVSKNTARYYNCANTTDEWTDCPLAKPRSGFFSTMGFLNSKPSSYLVENNNYGRVASMYFILWGEGFAASNDKTSDDLSIPPLPDCLESTDTRYRAGGPRGVVSIPNTDRLCQSCHVARHLAAGSVLFRPYSKQGFIFDKTNLGILDGNDYQDLIGSNWTYIAPGTTEPNTPVDDKLADKLVLEQGGACAVKTGGEKVIFNETRDLAKYLVENQTVAYRGFARHIHRAFANSRSVNLEIVQRMQDSFKNDKVKILDLVKAYVSSETFACKDLRSEVTDD